MEKDSLEPTTGIEPVNLFLTKEALYLLSYVGTFPFFRVTIGGLTSGESGLHYGMERETRFELATSSLEGWSSTN